MKWVRGSTDHGQKSKMKSPSMQWTDCPDVLCKGLGEMRLQVDQGRGESQMVSEPYIESLSPCLDFSSFLLVLCTGALTHWLDSPPPTVSHQAFPFTMIHVFSSYAAKDSALERWGCL